MSTPEAKEIFQLCIQAVEEARSNVAEVIQNAGGNGDNESLAEQFPDEWIFTQESDDVIMGWKVGIDPNPVDACNALTFVLLRGGIFLNAQLRIIMTSLGYQEYFETPTLMISDQ